MMRYFAILLFSLCTLELFAQFATYKPMRDNDSNVLRCNIYSHAFFKNNEYFHPIKEGYTLPGYAFTPSLSYQFTAKTMIETGYYLHQFAGKNGLYKPDFLFRIRHQLGNRTEMVLGDIFGAHNHRLIEPLYGSDNAILSFQEKGVQFLHSAHKFQSDLWLNWQRFILWDEPYQEQFIVGNSSSLLIYDGKSVEISAPLQAVIRHRGGQINNDTASLQNLLNYSGGIAIDYKFTEGFIQKIGVDFRLVGFSDFSPSLHLYPFNNGSGVYPSIHVQSENLTLNVAYWEAQNYFSIMGEEMFNSISNDLSSLRYMKNRQMIVSKIGYKKEATDGILLATELGTYYDVALSSFDYYFGVNLSINFSYNLLRYRPKF